MPKHVGVLVDGNRRWAKEQGFDAAGQGHAAGAKKITEFLSWCSELGISHVTLYLLSTDNLIGRKAEELEELIGIIVNLAEELAQIGRWKLQVVGDRDSLSEEANLRLQQVEAKTADNPGPHVNLAIAYGGRKEIADAMRSCGKAQTASSISQRHSGQILGEWIFFERSVIFSVVTVDTEVRFRLGKRLSFRRVGCISQNLQGLDC